MIGFPPCKINLGLSILEKRTDGFHSIETIFYPVLLKDALEIVISDQDTTIHVTGIHIPEENSKNLCIKAYELLKKDYSLPSIRIHLHKNIPIGAGLGGGSSDAAHIIKMLNAFFKLNLSLEKQIKYAQLIGSDCAFFIKNTVALATEKGDVLSEIKLSLSNYYIAIIKPPIHISTAWAYSQAIPQEKKNSIKNIIEQPIEQWRALLYNDFEEPIFNKYPVIRELKENMYKAHAIYASMSGSGSAVYGIFKNPPANSLLKSLDKDSFFWQGEMC